MSMDPTSARPTLTPVGLNASSSVHPLRRPRGVRRRREETAAAAIEIEELDSEVMRQNSYNYFQQHGGARLEFDAVGGATGGVSTAGSSRKRQRTLAEQLEELCLQPDGRATARSANAGAAAAAACRQAWSRVFASQLAAQKQRAAAAAAKAAPQTIDVEMDTNSAASSAAEDADLEDADEDDDSGNVSHSGRVKVFGGVPDVKGLFFASNTGRQRPMERMFRHYVTMAAERSARGENSSPRGDELVLFQPGPTSLEFPYSLFTPEQIEDLRARHNRKKKRQAAQERAHTRGGFGGPPSGSGYNSDHSWRFHELDSSDEADVSSSAEDSDMDMSGDGETRAPQLAGALSHGEWFVEDEDDDVDAEDDDL